MVSYNIQYVSNGDIAVLHWAIDLLSSDIITLAFDPRRCIRQDVFVARNARAHCPSLLRKKNETMEYNCTGWLQYRRDYLKWEIFKNFGSHVCVHKHPQHWKNDLQHSKQTAILKQSTDYFKLNVNIDMIWKSCRVTRLIHYQKSKNKKTHNPPPKKTCPRACAGPLKT